MNELLSLADRVEAATGADRELDLRIYEHVSGKLFRWSEFGGMPGMADQREIAVQLEPEDLIENFPEALDYWYNHEQQIIKVPAYTASLDAAMTLVDAECYWKVGHDGEGRDPSIFAARVFDPLTMRSPSTAVAETAALSLTAAALRAIRDKKADHA